jgi:hypothetical protein
VFKLSMNNPVKRGWLPWIGLVLALMCAGVWLIAQPGAPAPAPLLLLQRPFSPSVRLRDKVESRIPNTASWGWAHNLVSTIFGKRSPVNLDAESFSFRDAFSSRPIEIELGPPAFATRGDKMSVWFLTYGEITSLRARLESAALGSSYRCRVNTADGVGATVFVGSSEILNNVTNQVGVHHEYYPLSKPNGTDLFVSVGVSRLETNVSPSLDGTRPSLYIETNVDLAVRIQIPARKGVFLLQRETLAKGGHSAALVLDPL